MMQSISRRATRCNIPHCSSSTNAPWQRPTSIPLRTATSRPWWRSAAGSMACLWPWSWWRRMSECLASRGSLHGSTIRFALLIQGRRTALPRHQTLRATLDWSCALLPEAEQMILRRLAVFRGDFTIQAAYAVAADASLKPEDVVQGMANLVDKSLLAADIGSNTTYYRLLELNSDLRAAVAQDSGERKQVIQRHADYYRELFVRAGSSGGGGAPRLSGPRTTGARSTISAWRWIGRYRQTVTTLSASRWPPLRAISGSPCRC